MNILKIFRTPVGVLALVFFTVHAASAAVPLGPSNAKKLYFGLGLIDHEVGRLSSSPSGSASFTSAIYFDLNLTGELALSPSWYFSPYFAYTAFGYKGADKNQKSYLMPIALRLEKRFGSIDLHGGPGVLIYKISGSGGTTTLSNGTGTAVFGIPSESRTSQLVMLDFGVGIESRLFKTSYDFYVTGLASSRRAVSLAVNLTYGVF